jgi:hypothetical protein
MIYIYLKQSVKLYASNEVKNDAVLVIIADIILTSATNMF